MCSSLLHWEPFQHRQKDDHLAALMHRVDTSVKEDPAERTFEVLRWRSAIKLVQHEEAEMSAGIDRTYQLNIGKSYFTQKASKLKRSNLFVKSRRLCAKLSLPVIVNSLAPPCHKHAKPHPCLDMFRKHPTAALKWRKMWYALPKEDREERLRKMFSDARNRSLDEGEDEDAFRMHFQIFGMPMLHPSDGHSCRQLAASSESFHGRFCCGFLSRCVAGAQGSCLSGF